MHQKIQDWGHALLAFAIGLIALIGVLLFAWYFEAATAWRAMSAAEWGVWVGSIGTIGAIFGTIWLATAETRRRRQQERDLALMAVAGLTTRIGIMEGRTLQALTYLQKGQLTDGQHFQQVADSLKAPGMWEVDDIVPLVPLGGDLARDLAACRTGLQQVIQNMEWMVSNFRTDPLTREERFTYSMVRIYELLRRSHETCRKLNAEEQD